jgi:hypothetical protein
MKKLLTFIFLMLLSLNSQSQNSKKVLIIGIDGCRPDALSAADTPNIDNLILNGIYSPDALNDDITLSGPGWSGILCGVRSDKHGVINNDFSNNNYQNYPSFFKYIKDFDPNLHTVSFCHWGPINDYILNEYIDFKLNLGSDQEVFTIANNYINLNDPDIIFLHFDEVDYAGHNYGYSPNVSEYVSVIENIDKHVGDLMEAVNNRSLTKDEDWLILVTTDHGGINNSHGGNTLDETNTFVIASNASLTPKLILKDSVMIIDTSYNCLGELTELKFDGDNDKVVVEPNSLFNFGADQNFTIECRIRTNQSGDVAIIGNKDWASGYNKGFVFSFKYPSGPEWKVNIGDGSQRVDINTGGSIADNEWHTLSVSFNRQGFMKMYEDGMLIDSSDISFIGDINTGYGLLFGADIQDDFDFYGSIAEVRVWNSVLNDQTIFDWHCSPIEDDHPNKNDLIGYWKINEGSGFNEANDFSGNGNTGSISNAKWITDSTFQYVYDYSLTPRLIDIPPTVLAHLCIPVEDDWNLDGITLIPDCDPLDIDDTTMNFKKNSFNICPVPAKNSLQVLITDKSLSLPIEIEIFNSHGILKLKSTITAYESVLNLPNDEYGLFILKMISGQNRFTKKFLKTK